MYGLGSSFLGYGSIYSRKVKFYSSILEKSQGLTKVRP